MYRKLGRLERVFNPRIAHMSALLGAASSLPPIPKEVDWTAGVTDFGMMLNDTIGCCTCASYYHARQIWSLHTEPPGHITENDELILAMYRESCGYDPAHPLTDRGGIVQNVLTYLLNVGAPIANNERQKIIGFVEVDPRNLDDVKRIINDTGVAYIGFSVPKTLTDDAPPDTWIYQPTTEFSGGHAVTLAGYNDYGFIVISWGRLYLMEYEFFLQHTDECYGIIDHEWIDATGRTPLGLTVFELETLMQAIKD